MKTESDRIQGLIALSRKFRGYATSEHAADPEMMMRLSALYMKEAEMRFKRTIGKPIAELQKL